jgi:hypothetical protein
MPVEEDAGGNAVNAGFEEIQADVCAIEDSALHEVLHNGVRGVVDHHHLVALPANAAAHMEQGFRNELQGRRDFIREVSGWVEMPSV